MRTSERQRRILAAFYHQANKPVAAVAKQLDCQPHTVRREVENLTAAGLMRRQAFIDVYRLGYVQYELYFSLGAQRESAVKSFLKKLADSPRVAWIGQFSGRFQYVLTVCCRAPHS